MVTDALDIFGVCWEWWGLDACEATVVLVLVDEEREKLELALVETVRLDCSDKREVDLWRFRDSYVAFFV